MQRRVNGINGGVKPYGRGWRAPWRGQWGPVNDGHSPLGRLAKRIEKELSEEFDTSRPRAARLVRMAAVFEALSAECLDRLGMDAKATTRWATGLHKAAQGCIAQLAVMGARREPKLPTISDLISERAAGQRR
jgi:hypothetical protein